MLSQYQMKSFILYRDLKPQNILITREGNVKLSDFGLAKKVSNSRQLTNTLLGTPLYMAPQILKEQKYSSKCDIWSLGIILFEMLTGKLPWSASSYHKQIQAIQRNPLIIPNYVPKDLAALIRGMLEIDQENRLSWFDVFKHPAFGDNFTALAWEWEQSKSGANRILFELSKTLNIHYLMGAFLMFRSLTLKYDQFTNLFKWLAPQSTPKQIYAIHQQFDKDCNGLIDIKQFIGWWNVCSQPMLDLIYSLVATKPQPKSLQALTLQQFTNLCIHLSSNIELQLIKQLFDILSSLEFA